MDDLAKKRRDALWSRFNHPNGNQLSAAEMLEFLIGTAESIMPFISDEEAANLYSELRNLRLEEEARLAASEAVHQRTIRVCELVRQAQESGGAA